MEDERSTREYRKKSHINPDEKWERDYWSDKWGISDEQLSEAIESTGSLEVEKIEKYLINKKLTE